MESPVAVSRRLDVPTVQEILQAILVVRAVNPQSALARLATVKLSHCNAAE